jgi:hypothetical protein
MGVSGQYHAPVALPPRMISYPPYTMPFWMGTENLTPTGIQFPGCKAHNKLLYQMKYWICDTKICMYILICKSYRQFEIQFSNFSRLMHLTVSIHSLKWTSMGLSHLRYKNMLITCCSCNKKTWHLLHLMHSTCSTNTNILWQTYCCHLIENTLTQT